MAVDYKKIAAQVAAQVDQTETKAGGDFERTPIAEGRTVGRLIEYIELGVQPQGTYEGKEKPACATARFTFELLNLKKNLKEIEIDGQTVTVAERFSFNEAIKLSEKSRFKKLLKTATYGRTDITHFAQILNDDFLLTFKHNKTERDGKPVLYVNLYNDGVYGIEAPFVNSDPLDDSTRVRVPVPKAMSEVKIFIWDAPTKETWDSLYIAGTRTVKDAKGKESQVSKNWLQEKILSAKNFSGSALEDLLSGSAELTAALESEEAPVKAGKKFARAAEALVKDAFDTAPPAAKSPSKVVTKVVPKAVTKVVTKAKAEVAEEVDPLAALGL